MTVNNYCTRAPETIKSVHIVQNCKFLNVSCTCTVHPAARPKVQWRHLYSRETTLSENHVSLHSIFFFRFRSRSNNFHPFIREHARIKIANGNATKKHCLWTLYFIPIDQKGPCMHLSFFWGQKKRSVRIANPERGILKTKKQKRWDFSDSFVSSCPLGFKPHYTRSKVAIPPDQILDSHLSFVESSEMPAAFIFHSGTDGLLLSKLFTKFGSK